MAYRNVFNDKLTLTTDAGAYWCGPVRLAYCHLGDRIPYPLQRQLKEATGKYIGDAHRLLRCQHCATSYIGHHASKSCSDACAKASTRDRQRTTHAEIPCQCCTQPFHPRRSTGQFCSNACRQRAHRQRNAGGEP